MTIISVAPFLRAADRWASWINHAYPDLLQFGVSIATVIGALSLFAAAWSIASDWRRRGIERRELRMALLRALRVEALEIYYAVDDDVSRFNCGSQEDQHVFIWRPLPSSMIEQAIREPFLLALSPEQITELATLRIRIQRLNAFVEAKIAVVGAQTANPSITAHQRAEDLNAKIRSLLDDIRKHSTQIDGWVMGKIKQERGRIRVEIEEERTKD
jgi:hypothetical protein